MSDRRIIFDATRNLINRSFREDEVAALDRAIDEFLTGQGGPKKHALAKPQSFFLGVRNITGALDQQQVDTINSLLSCAASWPISWLAYGLATAWHEARLKPIEQSGKGRGRPYAMPGKYGQSQHGRGLVQLTWDANYERADQELNLHGSLLRNFDCALVPKIAATILIRGMEEGWFTGKALHHYLPSNAPGDLRAFMNARRIINGTDKAEPIARLALRFQEALKAGGW